MIRPIRFAFPLAVLLMVLGFLLAAAPMAFAQRGGIIDFASGDPEMTAAIATARASLPEFWSRHGAPQAGEDGFALKVAVPVGPKHNEHIWVGDVVRAKDGRLSGRFANQPRDIKGKKAGDAVTFTEAQVSDWMFMRRGKIVGAQTLRPMLKRLPKAQADDLRARLESP